MDRAHPVLKAAPLTPEAYAPYGDVVSIREGLPFVSANLGTARRYDWLAGLENLRPAARPNVAIFRCSPAGPSPFQARLLEKHPKSTQLFVPMSGAGRFLVVVALGGDAPDPGTLRAFLATREQGLTYKPGVWHHPLIALDNATDFACVVWENGGPDDCVIQHLKSTVQIEF